MAQCPTMSGSYRCTSDLDAQGKHSGSCEAQAPEYATRGQFAQRHGWWYAKCEKHGVTVHRPDCVDCPKPKGENEVSIETPTTAERQFLMMMRACIKNGVSAQFVLEAAKREVAPVVKRAPIDGALPMLEGEDAFNERVDAIIEKGKEKLAAAEVVETMPVEPKPKSTPKPNPKRSRVGTRTRKKS